MVCAYCGRVDTSTHGCQCKECAKRYRRYVYLKRRLMEQPCNETSEKLQAVIKEYRSLQARGYRVPKDLE